MKESNRNSCDPEDDTSFDFDGIVDSIHLELKTTDPELEQETQSQNGHDIEGDIFPELVYIDEDDSLTPFTFDGSLD